ncbi:hypothetical protein ACFCW2_11330 [Qipengyuania sp. DSG2-2]|uniref:hypothetical protein n=1 Tax=Qipengyuania sp. DGS2-2 TaxID=3349631 RepID=UPI0036D2D736
MIEGGVGGANTGTGLQFEARCDFLTLLQDIPGYEVRPMVGRAGSGVYFETKLLARTFQKHQFYNYLEEEGIDWKVMVSKKLLPDDAILVITRKTLNIVEVKFQKVAGSVDEKLQTCDFKRKQYMKLVGGLGLSVAYIYVLNRDWFDKPAYKDVLEYIRSVNCDYCFDFLPLAWLGLPNPDGQKE